MWGQPEGTLLPHPRVLGPRAPAQRSLLSHKHTEPHLQHKLSQQPLCSAQESRQHLGAGGQGKGKVHEPQDHHSQGLWSWLPVPSLTEWSGLPSEGRLSSPPEGKAQLCGAPDVCGTIGCHQEQSWGWKCATFFVRGSHYFMSCRKDSPGVGGCQR